MLCAVPPASSPSTSSTLIQDLGGGAQGRGFHKRPADSDAHSGLRSTHQRTGGEDNAGSETTQGANWLM